MVDTVNKVVYTLEHDKYYAHCDPSIADLPPDPTSAGPLTVTSSPLSLSATFEAVAGAVAYMLTAQKDGSGRAPIRTVSKGFTDVVVAVDSLKPETGYI